MKILIIEDDPDVVEVELLCFELRWRHTQAVVASTGAQGVELVEAEKPDLVVLDLGLPDIDGLEVCRQIRAFSDVPIVIITVRDSEMDIVKGLEMGADDYITKPFRHIELLARMQAVLRRAQAWPLADGEQPFVSGDLYVDFARREVSVSNHAVKLTPTEYNLLIYLARNAGQVVPHRVLLERVWGREYLEATDYLKVHIQRLRQKLGDNAQSPRMIFNERGIGYKLGKLPNTRVSPTAVDVCV